MYCGNCGKEVENDAAFCPVCGSHIPEKDGKKTIIGSKKAGKLIVAVVVITAIIIATWVGLKVYFYFQSIPTNQQLQLAVNNYQNGGIVTTDGKWLYYNDNGLCKVRLDDGSRQTVISSDIMPEKMFYAGDSIFYYKFPGIYKIQRNSRVETNLNFSVFAENCFQTDGKNYYVTGQGNEGTGVYSIRVRNTKKTEQMSDIHPTELLIYKDYIYILSRFNTINEVPNENYGTWRIDKDGKNKIELMSFCPSYMVFSGDMIFYTDKNGTICSMALDGSGQEIYEDTYVSGGLNVSDEYVFYIAYDLEGRKNVIHRMDKDGDNDFVLSFDDCSNINIAGDWIYYINRSCDYDIYKMSFDGEYNEPIY